jgi:hypothetical protein
MELAPPKDTAASLMQPHVTFSVNKSEKWRGILEKQATDINNRVRSVMAGDTNFSDKDVVDAIIDEAIEFDGRVRDKRIEFYIKRHFWSKIQELTGADIDYIFDYLEEKQTAEQKRRHDDTVYKGILSALGEAEDGNFQQAKERVQVAFEKAESIASGRQLAPIINVAQGVPFLQQQLKETLGLAYTGLIQRAIPELDNHTFGFDGLTLITAASGGGKTMFVIQTVLEILNIYDDICCLFVSADMTADRVMLRMLTNRSRLEIRDVKTGKVGYGWDEEQKVYINKGFAELQKVGPRIQVVDRFSMPNPTRRNIQRAATRLMEETGCERCIIVVDFLELLPIPEDEKNPDHFIIEEMRTLADNGHIVFAICESGKSETNYARGSAKNIKGDYRKIMRADIVITINPCIDDELLDLYEISNEGYVNLRASKEPFEENNARKRALRAERIRKGLKMRGQIPCMMKIDKGRDGAECGEFYVINHYRRNYFTPLKA